jgi:hypothetical protein
VGCGVAATALYFGMDLLAASLTDGYSYADQTISELSAIGVPTRPLWIPLGVAYSVLTIACGFGIWESAVQKPALRVVAAFVAAIGVLGLVAWPFAPMHQREVLAAGGSTLSDTLHLMLGAADTLLFVLSIAFGSTALGRRFRLYSIATILAVLASGAVTAMNAPGVADNEPTPWIGVTERVAVFGSMLWIAVLAIALWRGEAPGSQTTGGPA